MKFIILFSLISRLCALDLGYIELEASFKKPLYLSPHVNNSNILYVVEQRGMIWELNDGIKSKTPFLDIRDKVHTPVFPGDERGLLGFAMSPNFQIDNFIYVNYINNNDSTVISRFNGNEEEKLLSFKQPFSNHNGGMILFGPDGYLYISVGDGGDAGDPYNNSQNLKNFFGTILRIDVNTSKGYKIPDSNPFKGMIDIKEEIWSYGIRNAWRFSFDKTTGDMYMGDVGQNSWEEINFQSHLSNGGENYGWNHYEGDSLYLDKKQISNVVMPIYVYPNNANIIKVLLGWKEDGARGCSVTGGYVYRGDLIPELKGRYLFGDYCTGKIWSFKYENENILDFQDLTESINVNGGNKTIYISSFGQDLNGELYIIDYSGTIYKLINK
tara:strand:- start:1666 stop:2817 length:1152 start_codon:yes stop_codon:yes gene_type:complete